jgi:hypothetical protein
MDHAIDIVVSAIVFLGGLVFEFIGFIDAFLASLMAAAGIPPSIQLIILIIAAIIIMAYAIRALGGLFIALLLVLLVLLVLHKAFPGAHMPNFNLPLPGSAAGTVHT